MTSADFLAHRNQAYSKTSPGNARIPSHLYLPHIHIGFPYEYRALEIYASLPNQCASYEILVHQASALPSASFRHLLTDMPLPFG